MAEGLLMRLKEFVLPMSIVLLTTLALAVLAAPARGADDEAARKAKVEERIKDLGDKDAQVRRQAVKSLGDMGPEAKEAVPSLIKAFGDPDAGVRFFATNALGKIGRDKNKGTKTKVPVTFILPPIAK
jgi:HEAT repeat protein